MGNCQLFVYLSATSTCNLGRLSNSLNVVPTSSTGSAVMYTRKCKKALEVLNDNPGELNIEKKNVVKDKIDEIMK
jgi:hypothetical protein